MKMKTVRKGTLLSSVVALLLSCLMLVGTTFAWFTDSVSSGRNTIHSGNLDMELSFKPYGAENARWTAVTDQTPIFDDAALYEPGYTEAVWLKVSNVGSLAFRCQVTLDIYAEIAGKNQAGDDFNLSDYLVVKSVDVTDVAEWEEFYTTRDSLNSFDFEEISLSKQNISLADHAIVYSANTEGMPSELNILVVLQMPETVGNEANHNGAAVPQIQLGLNAVATQVVYEEDSFDNQYDKDAEYPVVETVVASGRYGGVTWTLSDTGKLTVSPSTESVYDESAKRTYEAGQWREAVRYANGSAKAIVEPFGDASILNAVTSLVIEEGVTYIGSFAAKFPNLTGEVVIPASVTYIGQEAFQNAPITKLTFAAGGTEELCIAPGAFKKLAIEEVVLPADRPAIHVHCWAFNDCTSLKKVTLPANITTFTGWTHVDYCGMDYQNGWDSQIFARCYALESITFGSQAVHDLFFNAAGNTSNINAIGDVEIIIQ